MQPAPTFRPPTPRSHPDWLVVLLAAVVALEAAWILTRTPVAIVAAGQSDVLLQGKQAVDNEAGGELVPGTQPPHMAHGEGREGDTPLPGGVPALPGANDTPTPGVAPPGRPRLSDPAAQALLADPYRRLLVGILAIDARESLSAEQAQALSQAVQSRERVIGTEAGDATRAILAVLTPDQLDELRKFRKERIRQGKFESTPEQLEAQIRLLLRTLPSVTGKTVTEETPKGTPLP